MLTPEQLALIHEAKDCWASPYRGGGPANHCAISPVEGRYFWTIHVPGDYISLGGMKIPLSTDFTPCDKHRPAFEKLFGGISDEEVTEAI